MSKQYNKYEKARLVGARAFQIAVNAPPMVSVGPHKEPIDLATEEYWQKKLPLEVVRKRKE